MKVESNYRRWNERAVPSSVMTLGDGVGRSPDPRDPYQNHPLLGFSIKANLSF